MENCKIQKEQLASSLWIEEGDCTEFTVTRVPSLSFKNYLAKICGADETYGLSRSFCRPDKVELAWNSVIYHYPLLSDGVYETSVKYFEKDSTTPVFVDRNIVILYRGDWEVFPFAPFPKDLLLQYVKEIRRGTFDWFAMPESLVG